jgi:hypothetical protein
MTHLDAELDKLINAQIEITSIAEDKPTVQNVMTQLAVMAERIRVQQEMIDLLKRDPVSYVDIERQDDRQYDEESR